MTDNLLIGVIESEPQTEEQAIDECLSYDTNRIGGHPVVSPQCTQEVVSAMRSLVCSSCAKRLAFVLQIYCPIDNSSSDRLIYLFVCLNTDCNPNKWFAFRSVTSSVESTQESQQTTDSTTEWLEGQEEWGDGGEDQQMDAMTAACADSLAQLSVNGAQEVRADCQPIIIDSLAIFRSTYISVIDEPTDEDRDDKHIEELMATYERLNSKQMTNTSTEEFEPNDWNSIYRNDRKNYEFFKRLSLCPKQVIRYQWMGTPLVNSDRHKPVVSECQTCGADRSFEFQLMPALISYLKPLSDSEVDIDFGTVLVYSCSKNCVKSGSLNAELCVVLSDPDNQFINRFEDRIEK